MHKNLVFLGCGNSVGSPYGTNSAVLRNGENLLLLDCGPTIPLNLKKSKLDVGVKHMDVFLSHIHGDHINGVYPLIEEYKRQGVKVEIFPSHDSHQDGRILGLLKSNNIENTGFANPVEVAKRHNLMKIECKQLKHTDSMNTSALIMTDLQNKEIIFASDHNDPNAIKLFVNSENFGHLFTDAVSIVQSPQTHIHINLLKNIIPPRLYDRVTVMHIHPKVVEFAKTTGFNTAVELLYSQSLSKQTIPSQPKQRLSKQTLKACKGRKLDRIGVLYKDKKKALCREEEDDEISDIYGGWLK